ncbi:MAG: LamG-like jellyroll fold domain-containing protein [Bacteroidota bacterium]
MKKHLLLLTILLSTNFLFAQVPSYVPTTGLLAWYNFNGNGANANNASLNTLANYGATFVPDRFGNLNAAAFVDGLGTQWMQLGTPSFTFSQTGAYTLAVWVKKSVQNGSGVILMSGTTTANNFITNIQGNTGVQFGACKQQSAWTWSTCADTIGAWMHLVGTYSNGKMKLYRDGVLMDSTTFTATGSLAVNQTLWVGRGPSGNYYTGVFDDIGIWNRSLTQAEITALYNSQTTTGLNNQLKNQTVVYPNPTKNVVSLKMDLGQNKKYIITNNEGKNMSEGFITNSDFKIDLTDFPSGVYYLNVVDSPIGSIKLVKE